jgi:hypothetical protein
MFSESRLPTLLPLASVNRALIDASPKLLEPNNTCTEGSTVRSPVEFAQSQPLWRSLGAGERGSETFWYSRRSRSRTRQGRSFIGTRADSTGQLASPKLRSSAGGSHHRRRCRRSRRRTSSISIGKSNTRSIPTACRAEARSAKAGADARPASLAPAVRGADPAMSASIEVCRTRTRDVASSRRSCGFPKSIAV